jgi:hypothetical protein
MAGDVGGKDARVLGDVLFVSPPVGQSMIAYTSEPNPVPLPPGEDTSSAVSTQQGRNGLGLYLGGGAGGLA